MFPLIFQFPLNVLCSYKALINSTCNSGLYRIYKHSYFLFFPAYNLSLIFCQLSEYLYFYKMKTCKISCRKVKMSISPRGGNFTSPTCNMTLRFGLEKCLYYLTEIRLALRYIGLLDYLKKA